MEVVHDGQLSQSLFPGPTKGATFTGAIVTLADDETRIVNSARKKSPTTLPDYVDSAQFLRPHKATYCPPAQAPTKHGALAINRDRFTPTLKVIAQVGHATDRRPYKRAFALRFRVPYADKTIANDLTVVIHRARDGITSAQGTQISHSISSVPQKGVRSRMVSVCCANYLATIVDGEGVAKWSAKSSQILNFSPREPNECMWRRRQRIARLSSDAPLIIEGVE
jgi:hypothetical protein